MSQIISLPHFCSPPLTGFEVSDSYKSKFSFAILEEFLIEYTAGRGLGIASNTPKMIVFLFCIHCLLGV
jgi:hypothetical protein